MLAGTHILLANITKADELKLSSDEAKTLAEASANVARHYNIAASQKAIDWYNFLQAMAIVYGGRLYVIRERIKAEREARAMETEPEPIGGMSAAAFTGG